MESKKKALLNYYVSLIRKGVKTIDDAPEELKEDITKELEILGEYVPGEGESE